MSGHSRWSQIKHKKAIADAKKGAIFGKLGRAISVAARSNPDPATNLRLKAEIDRARAVNMPSDNIQRAINRVSEKGAAELAEVQLELIGPGNVAVIIEAITDNSNRTINELRQLGMKHGARTAGQGSLLWMFRKAGVLHLDHAATDEEQLLAIDSGADDVHIDEGVTTILTPPEQLEQVRTALHIPPEDARIELTPTTTVPLPDEETRKSLETLLEALDEHDDVQQVFTNAS